MGSDLQTFTVYCLLITLLLSACGQSGSLYLPPEETSQKEMQ
ncbi:MAG: lipoprotein [Gammaproteobacteria bacterium]|nr:lipoprotein [Gammaproteobacteria bacterium]